MKTVAFVPMKLHSERLKNKNILPLKNHALCWYVPKILTQVSEIDEVYVYCSDETCMQYLPDDVLFLKRDKKLDDNFVKGMQIYEAFQKEVDADIYVLAHTTSPFMQKESVEKALHKVLRDGYDSAFSVTRHQTFAWYQGKSINYELDDVVRTQDIEPIYIETSGFYIFRRELLTKKQRRIGDHPYLCEVDQLEAIDIDEPKDFIWAKKLKEEMDL